jgi:hypothetical protein
VSEPYSSKGYLVDNPPAVSREITPDEAIAFARSRGFIIKGILL